MLETALAEGPFLSPLPVTIRGYVPLDRTRAQLLFEVITECYEHNTLIIHTNIEFSRWVNVFYDEPMTGAILERVFHRCHCFYFPARATRCANPG
jgi:DNA replication protein DnaC